MNINMSCIVGSLGYGVAGKNILLALDKLGHNVTYWPLGNVQPENQDEVPVLQKLVNSQACYDPYAPSVRMFHEFALAEFIGKGEHIGWPIFEMTNFKESTLHHLRCVDRLFVCSKWAKEVLNNIVPNRPVDVVPLGVNTDIFYPINRHTVVDNVLPSPPSESKPYVFMNIGKIEVRKGHDILVEAFNKAFTKDDHVQLWLMWGNPFLQPDEVKQWEDLYRNSPLGEKVVFLDRCQNQYGVAGLMRQADCGVFPSRAEGWNLDLLEMMACGKPVIATNYSAHTEFCLPSNGVYHIIVDELEPAFDGKWFFGDGEWAQIGTNQMDQLITHMQYCYKNQPSGVTNVETAKQFSWQHSAETLVKHLL